MRVGEVLAKATRREVLRSCGSKGRSGGIGHVVAAGQMIHGRPSLLLPSRRFAAASSFSLSPAAVAAPTTPRRVAGQARPGRARQQGWQAPTQTLVVGAILQGLCQPSESIPGGHLVVKPQVQGDVGEWPPPGCGRVVLHPPPWAHTVVGWPQPSPPHPMGMARQAAATHAQAKPLQLTANWGAGAWPSRRPQGCRARTHRCTHTQARAGHQGRIACGDGPAARVPPGIAVGFGLQWWSVPVAGSGMGTMTPAATHFCCPHPGAAALTAALLPS